MPERDSFTSVPNADQLIGQRRGGEKVFFVAGAYPDGQSLAEIEIAFAETYLGRIRDQRQPAVLERPRGRTSARTTGIVSTAAQQG